MSLWIILSIIAGVLILAAIIAGLFARSRSNEMEEDNENFEETYGNRTLDEVETEEDVDAFQRHDEIQASAQNARRIALVILGIAIVAAIGCGIGAAYTAFADNGDQQDDPNQEQVINDGDQNSDGQNQESDDQKDSDEETEAAAKSMDATITEADEATKVIRSMDDEATEPYFKKWGKKVDRQSTDYALPDGRSNDLARREAVGWAFAPTYGLKGATPEAKFEEWKKWLWVNPIYGDGFARFLEAHGFTTDGRNPWISEMIALAKIQGYQNHQNPEEGFWYYDEDLKAWCTTSKWQRYAACLESVASQLVIDGGMLDEYIVEHWPMDTGSNNFRHMYLLTENPQVQHGLKLGFPDKFGPDGKGSISFAFLVDDADGRLEVPGDQPMVITVAETYVPGCGAPPSGDKGGGNPPADNKKQNPPTDEQGIKDPSKDPMNTGAAPDARENEGTTPLTGSEPATATGENANAGSDDGTSDPSNGIQDSSATQHGSEAPDTKEIPVTTDTTATDTSTGATTNTSNETVKAGNRVSLDD